MRDHQPSDQPTHQSLESSDYPQPETESFPEGNRLSRRIPLGLLAGISAVVVLTGSATAWWTWNFAARNADPSKTAPATIQPSPVESPATNVPIESPAAQAPEPQSSSPVKEQTAEVYWLGVNAEQLELVASPVSLPTDQPDEALKVVFEDLLQGPSESAAFSEIPEGTELREVTVESDGVHVDLSEDFTVGGGSASMTGRLGQIVYTATSLEPEANVWISVEGEPLEVLGGEGLVVDQPMTREGFEQNFAL
ncbi:GerMN domain-containing protein [Leptolyngbya sp. FACHB-671]|uniref:GerMN domain-containing protein n=1 Tax=Leptolyngbya sp. FACHB-671 TaxID=2692812 RepID=UPI001686F9D0|nr:GerMN domain-containing protein [Leptolyngbya sp. FACHB-671]MBD2070768.1 GerMN domain-containing protein [Leptolyngbya sp. FACHB-671]